MAPRKLRLEIQQSNEQGECGNLRVPRWYGQHSITTGDITGSVMKILITDSKGERISVTIGNNGSIQGVNNNRENKEDHRVCISPNDLQIERRMNANGNNLPGIVNNQQQPNREISDFNSLAVKEELKECGEPSSITFKEVLGVISEGYKSEPLEPDVEEEFHTETERIKFEGLDLARKYETICIDSEILLHEQSSQISAPMIQSSNDINLLCRLCATQGKDMISIFSPNDVCKNITEKIQDCLPILVGETDKLPKQVCRLCLKKLELFHKFYETVTEAEKQLNILSEKISEGLKNAEKINETLPPQEVQLDNEKSGEKLLLDKKPTIVKLCSLPVTLKSPKLLNTEKQVADKNNTDEDIIFMGEIAVVDDFEDEDEEEDKDKDKDEDEGEEEEEEEEEDEEEFDIIKCRICGLFFGSAESCYMHALIHNSEDYYPCSMCNEILDNRADSFKHSLQHVGREEIRKRAPLPNKNGYSYNLGTTRITERDNADSNIIRARGAAEDETSAEKVDEDMVKCRICGKYFGSARNCYKHSTKHGSDNYWPCSMCEKTFSNATEHWRHSHQHTVTMKRQPWGSVLATMLSDINPRSPSDTGSERLSNSTKATAGKDETTVENQASIENSNGKNRIKCRICNATFLDTGSCFSHARVHIKPHYYPCVMCHKIFTTRNESWKHALDHVKENNREKQPPVYMCLTCGKKFVTEERLRFHELYHNPNKRPCYCEECDKILATERSLYRHMLRVHQRSKKYTCDICNEWLRDQSQLDSHRLKHTIKRFECSVCRKSFLSNDQLELHKREHRHYLRSKDIFSCFYCGKTFLQKSHLSDHIRNKIDECPYNIFSRTSSDDKGRNKDETTLTAGGISNSKNSCTEKKRPSDSSLSSELFRVKRTKTENPRAIYIHGKQCQCDVCEKKFRMPNITQIERITRNSMK